MYFTCELTSVLSVSFTFVNVVKRESNLHILYSKPLGIYIDPFFFLKEESAFLSRTLIFNFLQRVGVKYQLQKLMPSVHDMYAMPLSNRVTITDNVQCINLVVKGFFSEYKK